MLRQVTWRFWAVIFLALSAYTVLGVFFDTNGRVESDIYAWGLVAATTAPIVFVIVYSLLWRDWRHNDLGVNLVLAQVGLIPMAGVLAYVFLFEHGQLTNPIQAWIEIGSPWWTAIWLYWRNFIFFRIKREESLISPATCPHCGKQIA
jgi:hypothetical protein